MVSAFFCVISNLVRNVKEKYWSFDAKCGKYIGFLQEASIKMQN